MNQTYKHFTDNAELSNSLIDAPKGKEKDLAPAAVSRSGAAPKSNAVPKAKGSSKVQASEKMAAAQKEAEAAAQGKAKHLEDPEAVRKRVGKSASIKRKSKYPLIQMPRLFAELKWMALASCL